MAASTFIGELTDVPFDDEEAMDTFLGIHDMIHGTIMLALADAGYVVPVRYPLFGNPDDDANWKLNHYTMHQVINIALDLSPPPDLADIDFDDEGAWHDWHQSHAIEHEKIARALNL